jgi:hypothetical protein
MSLQTCGNAKVLLPAEKLYESPEKPKELSK